MAIAAPVVLLIIFGVIETSFVFQTGSISTSAARAGARLGASAYGDTSSPAERATVREAIADSVEIGLDDLPNSATPTRLIIYRADTDGLPDSGDINLCSTNCMRFTWDVGTEQFTFAGGTWNSPENCGTDLDRIGVHVDLVHDPFTAFFLPTFDIHEGTVMRLEPGKRSAC